MRDFIYVQYNLYASGAKSIGIEKIKRLAEHYLTPEERKVLFGSTNGGVSLSECC